MRTQRGVGAGLIGKLLVLAALAGCAGDTGAGPSPGGGPAGVAIAPVSTAKVVAVPGLHEPFITTHATTAAEDQAIDDLARELAGRNDDGLAGLAPLTRFVDAYPHSGWSASVSLNLGLAYYHAGYFSRAIAAFEGAWHEGRTTTDWKAKPLVDRAVGELAKMHARVGHADELEALFAEIGDRPFAGPATELVTGAREGSWQMRNNPGIAYLCGPKALKNALLALGRTREAVAFLDDERSGTHGVSLAQLDTLASRAGLPHRLVHRAPGQAVPVPSVIHWKVSHYAAVVSEEGGRYHIVDPTFGGDLVVSREAIDAEASGFFLVPRAVPQDGGWRDGTPAETAAVHGMGYTNGAAQGGNNNTAAKASTPADVFGKDLAPTPAQTTAPGCSLGMCVPDTHLMSVSLNLNDTPVGYTPPSGPPVYVRLAYNQREETDPYGPPAVPTYSNVGPKWTLNVLSWVEDAPTTNGSSVTRYLPEGGAFAYAGYSTATGNFTPEMQTGAVLSRAPMTGAATSYTLTGTDGSKLVYAQPDGATAYPRRMFLTSIVDAQGNALTLTYGKTLSADAGLAAPDGGVVSCPGGVCQLLTGITDANGRTTTFTYGLAGNPLLVTAITDPFGRSATLTYDATARLTSITDVLGITSSVEYDDGHGQPSFVSALRTPYGTTRFSGGETLSSGKQVASRFLETTDPLGATERYEFIQQAAGIVVSDPVATVPVGMPVGLTNNYMQYRNTFYWDKSVYPQYGTGAGKDYTKAKRWHWLHTAASNTSPMPESVLNPLENRIWFTSVGQGNSYYDGTLYAPTGIGRVLEDGTSQVTTATYNAIGKPLTITDPLGRSRRFTYAANNVDLLTIEQATSPTAFATVARFSYNAQHLPVAATDAAGQSTRFGYNSAGQPISVTNPLERDTFYAYDDRARLTTVTDANGVAVLKLTYDDQDWVKTRTDAAGYVVSYAYDAFDRVTQVTYPDGTSQTYDWRFQSGPNAGTQSFEVRAVTDRLSRKTTYEYDVNRRLLGVTDPLSQIVSYDYYPNGALFKLINQKGYATSWDVDLQSRPVAKHYATGPASTVAYEKGTSRVKSVTDGRGQTTSYAYNVDDTLAGITYPTGTAPVSFQYDPFLPRRTSMTDQFGQTTYIYYPLTAPMLGAGRLQSIVSPVAGAPGIFDTVSYGYDELGRIAAKQVDGTTETVEYDTIGRPKTVANALDTFTYQYADETARVASLSSTTGPKVTLDYFGAAGDDLLKRITYTGRGNVALSQFGYEYDAAHNVTRFIQSYPGQKLPGGDGGTMGLVLPPADPVGGQLSSPPWDVTLVFATLLALGALAFGRTREGRARFTQVARPLAVVFLFVSCGGGSGHQDGTGGAGGMPGIDGGTGLPGGPFPTTSDAATEGSASFGPGQVTAYAYDASDRLIAARVGSELTPPTPATTPQFAYGYDQASNITSVTANSKTRTTAHSATNAISGAAYDLNGSLTALGDATYSWDGANRLLGVKKGDNESIFSYDGFGRMVRIVERKGGASVADKAYTWSGTARVLEHDNLKRGAPIAKRYFGRGFIANDERYFMVSDRQESSRQVVDDRGNVRAQYDYDPYGAEQKVSGELDSDVGYSGLIRHKATGLAFALFRSYDALQGRWLNRDPVGETGGVNLYEYVLGNPLSWSDPSGLTASCPAKLSQVSKTTCDANAPQGWVPYGGDPDVYHCGATVFLEKRTNVASAVDDPIAECAYDAAGGLIDEKHPYSMCRGTPDQYPFYGFSESSLSTGWHHMVDDSGGPAIFGGGSSLGSKAKKESQRYADDYAKDPKGVMDRLRRYHGEAPPRPK